MVKRSENVDELFTSSLIDEVDASTSAVGQTYDEMGNPIPGSSTFAGSNDEDLIEMDADADSVNELFEPMNGLGDAEDITIDGNGGSAVVKSVDADEYATSKEDVDLNTISNSDFNAASNAALKASSRKKNSNSNKKKRKSKKSNTRSRNRAKEWKMMNGLGDAEEVVVNEVEGTMTMTQVPEQPMSTEMMAAMSAQNGLSDANGAVVIVDETNANVDGSVDGSAGAEPNKSNKAGIMENTSKDKPLKKKNSRSSAAAAAITASSKAKREEEAAKAAKAKSKKDRKQASAKAVGAKAMDDLVDDMFASDMEQSEEKTDVRIGDNVAEVNETLESVADAGGYDDLPDIDDAIDDAIDSALSASAGRVDSDDSAFNDFDAGEDDESDEYDDEYEQVDLPDWADSIRRKINANVAHAFLLNGNVRDYMVRNITIKDGLVAVLDPDYEDFDIIAEYDQAHGIYFYGEDIEVGGEDVGGRARTLADAYKERFIEEMQKSQERLSIPVTDEIPNRDTITLFTILSDMFEHESETRQGKILLFIDYSDLLVPDASSAQMKPEERKLAITLADIGRSQAADDAGNVLIFITDDMTQLSTRIRSAESRIEQVKIPIPDRDDRADFIEHVLDVPENTLSDGTQVFAHEDTISKEQFAINSAGLSRIQIEDIMLRALSEDTPLTIQLMKERKQEIIREDYDDVLEIVDPQHGFERVGGAEHMKEFFKNEIIEPVHAGEKEAVPMGAMLAGPPGTAKAQAISQHVPTINGMKPAGNIAPGEIVFGLDGKPYKVTGVSPQGMQDAYEVVLSDYRSVICSGDHYWTVLEESHGEMKERLYTTKYMLAKGVNIYKGKKKNGELKRHSRFYLPMPAPVQYPEKELSVDPYVLGAMIGDGSCKEATLTLSAHIDDKFVPEEIARLTNSTAQYCKTEKGYHDTDWRFAASNDDIEKMKMFFNDNKNVNNRKLLRSEYVFRDYPEIMVGAEDKFIPDDYKYASIEQRWSLIQGLMDTDGTPGSSPDYIPSFGSISKRLCEDVCEVICSLGYSAYIVERKGASGIREIREKKYHTRRFYQVHMQIPNNDRYKFFRLPRKVEAAKKVFGKKQRRHYERKSILAINKLNYQEEMVCFTVNSPDSLFLIGDYIPTHNTFLSKAVAKEAGMNFVALNLNRIMEKWVGSTERNLDRALDCALAMAPTIIFIDEIDEALPNRADPNASAVNKRINQRLLTFFSDTSHRGEVIILAATNYPEKIDPAFKRAGRFDVRVPMFAPDEFDRMRIMRVIAKGRGFEFSWFEDPDETLANPFVNLKKWFADGGYIDSNKNNEVFFGAMAMYKLEANNSEGNPIKRELYLPTRIIAALEEPRLTLQQFYECSRILFLDMPVRTADASTGATISDEEYKKLIQTYLHGRKDILGDNPTNIDKVFKKIWKWEKIYSAFADQTFRMTGAELDVVMNKAINLFKKWVREHGDEKVKELIERGVMKHERDILWNPFLLEACKKTVNATSGIKSMEDSALVNTSDSDFIPDALYMKTDDGRMISYAERHEELIAAQDKSTMM